MVNIHSGHRGRLRRQALSGGLQGLHQHQILELLLFYAIPQKDTNELAHNLINRFNGLDGVFNATVDELTTVKGVGKNTAVLIKAVIEVYSHYGQSRDNGRVTIDNSYIAEAYYSGLFRGCKEEMIAVTLVDDSMAVVSTEKIPLRMSRSDRRPAAARVAQLLLDSGSGRCVIAHFSPQRTSFDQSVRELMEGVVNAAETVGARVESYFLIDCEGSVFCLSPKV